MNNIKQIASSLMKIYYRKSTINNGKPFNYVDASGKFTFILGRDDNTCLIKYLGKDIMIVKPGLNVSLLAEEYDLVEVVLHL